jgi:hypothetical protein
MEWWGHRCREGKSVPRCREHAKKPAAAAGRLCLLYFGTWDPQCTFPPAHPTHRVCCCAGHSGWRWETVSRILLLLMSSPPRGRGFSIDCSPAVSFHLKCRLLGKRRCRKASILWLQGQQVTQKMLSCLIFPILLLPLVMQKIRVTRSFFTSTCFPGIPHKCEIFIK